MKISHIELSRFKRFKHFPLDISIQPGIPNIILLVGDNGVGKTTILQSIAATLGTATKQIVHPQDLNWMGFISDGFSANHRGSSEIKLTVEFTADELEATKEFYEQSDYSTLSNATAPKQSPKVTLIWNTAPIVEHPISTSPKGAGYLFQFQGRRYAYNLLYNRHFQPSMFERIGGVFWYTEQRTAYSLAPFST
jgi:energy-coupling factor transporter ATP-binding protein EcfA2